MRLRAKRWHAALSAALLGLMWVAVGGQTLKSAKDGVFTDEQATRGQSAYKEKCSTCHGDDLSGGGFAPALTADIFFLTWADRKLDALSSAIRDTMPADKPGTLSADASAELVAFLLKANGFPAGQQSLPSDAAALQQIVIPKP